MAALRGALVCTLALSLSACARVPPDRYGVQRLRFEGMESVDARALAACLATEERDRSTITIPPVSPTCGEPPFEIGGIQIRLWTWGWTEWPLFDITLWQRDLERIIRWYQARGFPDARVVETRIEPATARESDVVTEETDCERRSEDQGCLVRLTVVIDEGDPILVRTIEVESATALDDRTRRQVRGAIELQEDQRFDEYYYEVAKERIAEQLTARGHCRPDIQGSVRIHRGEGWADVRYRVDPGPVCELGMIRLEGYGDLSPETLLRASNLAPGQRYDPIEIRDAQQAIYDLGAFAGVEVEAQIPTEGAVVPVVIRVNLARRNRFLLGGGIQSGLTGPMLEIQDDVASQWDIHLLGRWENRNFLGGMRRLTIEDRPRLIWNEQFPRTDSFEANNNLGNIFTAEFQQPAFLEARTSLLVTGVYDFGPDPFLGFTRHSLRASVALARSFWRRRIRVNAGIHTVAYQVPGEQILTQDEARTDWVTTFWQQEVDLDLRDRPLRTRRGVLVRLRLQEAGYGLPADWNYIRFAPEIRAFAPLPAGMVLAGHFRLGMMFVEPRVDEFDGTILQFGPVIHRFRGGGPVSNRGFLAQRLGDGQAGGTRLWETSLELRVPVSQNLWLATFADMGDSHREASFRWNFLQLSVGAGIRYYTIVGPIRLDVGFRVPGAQVVGAADDRVLRYCLDPDTGATIPCEAIRYHGQIFGGPAGAIHLTIGEAF